MGGRIGRSLRARAVRFPSRACFTPVAHPQPIHSAPEIDLTGVKILVADDNETNRLILNEALSSWGALVTEVQDGTSALLELQNDHATKPYRLVLLDCRMPGLSGFEVVQKWMETSSSAG